MNTLAVEADHEYEELRANLPAATVPGKFNVALCPAYIPTAHLGTQIQRSNRQGQRSAAHARCPEYSEVPSAQQAPNVA